MSRVKPPFIQIVRTEIADYLREQAKYRRHKQEQYPDDSRNSNAARSLEEVADYVQSLPDDNEVLKRLADCRFVFHPDGVFSVPCPDPHDSHSESGREASQCGFHGAVTPSSWFETWVETVLGESVEAEQAFVREFGEIEYDRGSCGVA